jgi:hypothetical protein
MNRLENYVQVHERLERAAGVLQTVIAEPPVMLTDVMGYIRATVALSDGRSATGTASFRLDLQGKSAQATNPIEDCETSAIGRALGILGFGSKDGIASREEVQEAQRRQDAPPARTATGATDKQMRMIAYLRHELQWTTDQMRAFASSRHINVDDLSTAEASKLIEALQATRNGTMAEAAA